MSPPTEVAGCRSVAHVVSLGPPIRGSCSGRQPKVVVGPDYGAVLGARPWFGGFSTGMAGVLCLESRGGGLSPTG